MIDADPHIHPAPSLADFVYQVLCVRARRDFAPLDSPTLRGLLQRNGLRPADLLTLSRKPLDVLNLDDADAHTADGVSSLFTEAALRRGGAVHGEARTSFISRLAEVIRGLEQRTPFRFLPPATPDASLIHLQVAQAVGLGLPARALGAQLARHLPTLAAPPADAAPMLPQTSLPGSTPPAPLSVLPIALHVAPRVDPAPVAALAALDLLCSPALPCPAPEPIPPWPTVELARGEAPGLSVEVPVVLPEARDRLVEAGLTPEGTRALGWRSIAALTTGLVGGGVGLVLMLEALVGGDLWLGVAGAATMAASFALDLALGWWARSR